MVVEVGKVYYRKVHFNAVVKRVLDIRDGRVYYECLHGPMRKSGKRFEFPVHWGMDLQSEHERWLTEEHVNAPVIVMNYPKEIKAFYMRMNDDGKTVAAMDVLAPGIGAQGATPADLPAVFGAAVRQVVPNVSRGVLRHGPDVAALRASAERFATEITAAVASAGDLR